MSGAHLPDVIQLFIIVLTALSASGLFAALFTRHARKDRADALASVLADSEKIDSHSVALQSLRFELEAAKVEMEKRRMVLVAQEETIKQQRQELLDAQQRLANHEATIVQFSRWAEWVTRILEDKGIDAPPPPIPIPVTPPAGSPKE